MSALDDIKNKEQIDSIEESILVTWDINGYEHLAELAANKLTELRTENERLIEENKQYKGSLSNIAKNIRTEREKLIDKTNEINQILANGFSKANLLKEYGNENGDEK